MTIDTCFPDGPPAVDSRHDVRQELAAITNLLSEASARLDAVAAAEIGRGLAVMSVDEASQAVHLALIELRGCLTPQPAAA